MTSAPEKVWVEEVWVPIGTEARLQDLARAMGSTRRPNRLLTSPTGRLMAIERKVHLPGKASEHFWLQVVLNPWTWAEQQPVIDLLNVDLSAPEGFTIVDTDEGRCRWEASNAPWPEGAPPEHSGEWLLNVVHTVVASAMQRSTSRPFSPKPTSSGLRFPAGLLSLETSFTRFAEQRGLLLRTEDDHRRKREEEALRARREAEQRAVEEEQRRLRRDRFVLDLQQAEDESSVEAVLARLTEEHDEDLRADIEAIAEARRSEVTALRPMPSFDDPSFTADTSVRTPRRAKGIRTWSEED